MESSEGVGFSINREAMKKSFAVGMNDTEEMENSKGETVELPWKDRRKRNRKHFLRWWIIWKNIPVWISGGKKKL